jgi:hypothetical protein
LATTVGRVVEVMNARGGPGLVDNYLGEHSNGNGKLVLFGGQYDLSIGKLVSYTVTFTAGGPDLVVSLFGISGKLTESDEVRNKGLAMNKFGGEFTYGMLSWLAGGLRCWREYRVLFAGVEQIHGWGDPRPSSVDPSRIFCIDFSIDAGQTFDVCVDDLQLLKCKWEHTRVAQKHSCRFRCVYLSMDLRCRFRAFWLVGRDHEARTHSECSQC